MKSLFVDGAEQRPSRQKLGDNGELTRILQTSTQELDDVGTVERAEDGHFSAEHLHVALHEVGVGPVPLHRHRPSLVRSLEHLPERSRPDGLETLDVVQLKVILVGQVGSQEQDVNLLFRNAPDLP